MPVPTAISDLTTVAATNSPQGTETVKGTIDDYFRAHASFIRQIYDALLGPTVVLASASTVNIGFAASQNIGITGTTTINAFDTYAEGTLRWVVFSGALQLTHNATSMQLPGSANIITTAGDAALFKSLGGGNWKCMDYQRLDGQGAVRCLPLAGGTMTGPIVYPNNVQFQVKDSGGTNRQLFNLAADNTLNWTIPGGSSWNIYNQAGSTLVYSLGNTGNVAFTGTMTMDNARALNLKDAGGTARAFVSLAADNNVYHTVAGGQNILWFNQAFTTQLASLTNAGAFSAVSLTATSDERFKWKWQKAPNDLVQQLAQVKKVGSFTWRGRHKALGQGIGVAAQALEAIWPDFVETGADGYKKLQYGPAAMVSVIKVAEYLVDMEARFEKRLRKLEAK